MRELHIEEAKVDRDSRLHRAKRGRRFKQAVLTSVLSKAMALAVQMLALTLGVRLLGGEGYAAYASIWAISLIPYIFMLGYGPSLIARVAEQDVQDNPLVLCQITWSALVPLFGNAIGVGAVATIVLGMTNLASDFYKIESLQSTDLIWTIIFLIWFQLLGSVLAALEGIQAGFQENHVLNIRSGLGSCIAVGAIWFVFRPRPELWVFVLCLHVPTLLTRLANAFDSVHSQTVLAAQHRSICSGSLQRVGS